MKLSLKIVFLSFTFFCVTNSAQAALVQCGNSSVFDERCKLCHLIEGMDRIIDWGMQILVVCALLGIVAGGIMYIISAGNSGMMESAKGLIKQALWGVVIVLGAWVIVNTTLWMIGSKIQDGGTGGEKFLSISNWYSFDCNGGGGSTSATSTCNYTYSDWSECTLDSSGYSIETRNTTSYPADCSGDPVFVRSCGSTSNCNSYTITWSPTPCTAGATQTSSAVGVPAGCTIDSVMFTPETRTCASTSNGSTNPTDQNNDGNQTDGNNQTDGTTNTDGNLPVDGDNNTNTNNNNTGTTDTPTSTSDNNVSPLNETGIREFFDDNGIKINNPNACTAGQTSGCTTVTGLRKNTISGVLLLKDRCGGDECNITITGGTEGSGTHSQSGVYNHVNGYKVDLRPNAELNSYIEKKYTKLPEPRSDGAIGYKDFDGNVYYYEKGTSTKGPHWDVTYY